MSQDVLHCALLQYDIVWENPSATRSLIQSLLHQEQLSNIDLVILPEMCTTGFSMNVESLAETMDGPTIQWLRQLADQYQTAICGSIIIKENDSYYNRFLWVQPNAEIQYYDKKHLFSLAEEHKHFTPGKSQLLIQYKGWNIKPYICYDLRFPVWVRSSFETDIHICIANFPEKRALAWNSLLAARAIENQVYLLAVNRIGLDGMQIPYVGDSQALDYEGKSLVQAGNHSGLFRISLEKQELAAYRRAYPFLRDADHFHIV